MGRVWAARQCGPLQRLVAIKTALCESSQTPEFERVFMDEARIASMIHHPHVCGVYELGEQSGVLYLVMEWSDGGTLLEVMQAQPQARLHATMAAAIVARVCAGLHAAHELEDETGQFLNVVHRDVSPQNVLLSSHGHVRLADFGVAKAQGQLHRPTETGEVKGKLSYMAPEQLTSKNLDRRVDIFALGCVLYESTVGRRPFQGDGALSTLYQILEEDVTPPSSLVEGYPAGLERVVLRALEKDPVKRYQTAESMQKDLESWLISNGSEIGERDIAKVVNEALVETIERRKQEISAAMTRLDAKEARPSMEEVALSASTQGRVDSSAPGVASGPQEERRSSVLGWAVGGLAAALTVLGLLLVATNRPGPKHDDAALKPAVGAEVQAASVVQPELVRVTVTTVPADAQVRLDEGEEAQAPLQLELLPQARERTLEVSASGYHTKTERVVLDKATELRIELEPLVEGATGPHTGPEQAGVAATARPASPALQPSTSRRPKPVEVRERPEEVVKPKTNPAPAKPASTSTERNPVRELDKANPFF